MKNLVFTTGYLGRHTLDSKTRKVETFKRMVDALNAVIIDIRMSPWSVAPCWRKQNLQALLGDQYLHVPDLGNVNYNRDAPITINRLNSGIQIVRAILRQGDRNPILMCGCDDYEICHRKVVAEALREYSMAHRCGLTVVEIDCWQDTVEKLERETLDDMVINAFDSEMLKSTMRREIEGSSDE